MALYDTLVSWYNQFLTLFPPSLQWLVTLMVVVAIVVAFISLIRFNWLFLLLLIVLVPFFLPILQHLFGDLYAFFLYLLTILKITAPKT